MKKASLRRLYTRVIRNPIELVHARVTRGRFAPEDVLIITGDPRSGTTWLGSMLSARAGVSTITEPLSLIRTRKHVKELGFSWRHFINPEAEMPAVRDYFNALFCGQVVNVDGRRDNSIGELLRTRRWLIKFVRANRLLPWLVQNYDFRYRPVLIIRHPCGVIYSQILHRSFDELIQIEKFDVEWIERYRTDLIPLTKRIYSEAQIRALTWALDNWIPLYMVARDRVTIVTYEQLVEKPEEVLRAIYASWGEELPTEIFRFIRRPSRSTYDWAEFDDSGMKRLGTWKQHLSGKQVKEIIEVVNAVGLMAYSDEILPDYDQLQGDHATSFPETDI